MALEAFPSSEREAPFNMAIATLKRLDLILIQIRQTHIQYPQYSTEKQKAYIDLVKQFYLNAIPLIDYDKDKSNGDEKEKTIKQLGTEILDLHMETQSVISGGNQKTLEIYSSDLEIRLNKILCDLQYKLKPFFMPTKGRTEGLI